MIPKKSRGCLHFASKFLLHSSIMKILQNNQYALQKPQLFVCFLLLCLISLGCPKKNTPINDDPTKESCMDFGDGFCTCYSGWAACDANRNFCFDKPGSPGCACYNAYQNSNFCIDPNDSTTCGSDCGEGQCNLGKCICPDASNIACKDSTGNFMHACVDLQNDNANCGACGNDCEAGKCIAGQCDYSNLECCARTPSGIAPNPEWNPDSETGHCWTSTGSNCLNYAVYCGLYAVSSVNVPASECTQANARYRCEAARCGS